MQRSSLIAVAGALSGVLVASTVAGVAIMNASASEPAQESVVLVADTAASSDAPAASLPPASTGDLPPIPVLADPPAAAPSQSAAAAPDPAVGAAPAQAGVTTAQARSLVLQQVAGTVLGVNGTERGGYDAVAVRVQRADGSVVIGYVDRASGVVFDWKQVSGPSTPAAQSDDDDSQAEEDDDSDEQSAESDDDEDDEHEAESEYETEHENDDD